MLRFNVIAFTHHTMGVEEIGKFHLEEDQVVAKMQHLKDQMNLEEIMYISTCNRVEFVFVSKREINVSFGALFLNGFNPSWDSDHTRTLLSNSKSWNGINAINHLIEVACSLDSMVIGEREIITQMKNAFEFSRSNNLSGDTIRIVMQQVIQTAKKVFTQTDIATKPVSVVSLACHQLRNKGLSADARVIFIGAGVSNINMGRFLKKHEFSNFTIFNRSLKKAQLLADQLNGKAHGLGELGSYEDGFDLLVSCTGSKTPLISKEVYTALLNGEEDKKIIIDLGVPADLDLNIKENFDLDHISIEYLKTISESNLAERKKELIKVRQIIFEAVEEFKKIFEMRQIELKMRTIPERVKEIRAMAMNEVFSKDIEKLDNNSKELIEKILNYMEKKYVSVPMLVVKEMLGKNESN